VSGTDPGLLRTAVATEPGTKWQQIPSSLEDVFIHLMAASKDNFR